jgi:hypothetical protein
VMGMTQNKAYIAYTYGESISGIILNVLMIISGVGLLRMSQWGACELFCVSVGGNETCWSQLRAWAGSRSSKMMAKWFNASLQFRIGIVHFLDAS